MNKRPTDWFKIITNPSELPRIGSAVEVFADCETISGDKRRGGTNPWAGDRAVGWAFTIGELQQAFYIPLRHKQRRNAYASETTNMPLDSAKRYLQDLFGKGRLWINHNIKFDAHVAEADGIEIRCDLHDTLNSAKFVDKQAFYGQYGQKQLVRRWLGEKPVQRDQIKKELAKTKSKDYGDVDASILGEYAADDVWDNRRIYYEILRRRYAGDDLAWEIECDLTKVLWNIERRGVKVDLEALSKQKFEYEHRMVEIEDEISDMYRGYGIGECAEEPGANLFGLELSANQVDISKPEQLKDFLFNTLKLPVLVKTEKGNPSLNADAVKLYQDLPEVLENPKTTKLFKLLSEYSDVSQFNKLYANGWLPWIDNEHMLHSQYTQMIETGRMASTKPNIQQLNKVAKRMIIPDSSDKAIMHQDFSQIEYRVIGGMTRDQRIAEAYRNDPKTDFHRFVVTLISDATDEEEIDRLRSGAKSVNFGIAYGMSDATTERSLRRVLGGKGGVVVTPEMARSVLDRYHSELPRVKIVAEYAKNKARKRAGYRDGAMGYIKTLYGSQRGLRYYKYRKDKEERKKYDDGTRKAFNTTVQGTAAYIMKEALLMVETDKWCRGDERLLEARHWLLEHGIETRAIVHDDLVTVGPNDERTMLDAQVKLSILMNSPSIDIGVPLMTDGGWSPENWAMAD